MKKEVQEVKIQKESLGSRIVEYGIFTVVFRAVSAMLVFLFELIF